MSTKARYYLSPKHGLVDLWVNPELGPTKPVWAPTDLTQIQWWRDEDWSEAFYDEEDDEVYTQRKFQVEGVTHIEILSLSPLRTAHFRFDAYPSLHKVIMDAQIACGDGHARDALGSGFLDFPLEVC